MTPERYRAELKALAHEVCDDPRCGGAYPIAEMARCTWCDNIFCGVHFHVELDCCHTPTCVYQSANRLRELRDAALVVLDEAHKARLHICAQRKVRAAISVLLGETMKDISFSDAIRLGAAQGPQLFNEYRDNTGGSCVAGAAIIGAGYDFKFAERWPQLFAAADHCPVCSAVTYTAGGQPGAPIVARISIVVHLNNDHRWTREAIADWWDENFSAEGASKDQPALTHV